MFLYIWKTENKISFDISAPTISPKSTRKLTVTQIAGVVIGCVLGVVILICIAVLLYRR